MKIKRCHFLLTCLGLILLLSASCTSPPSPLAHDLKQVKPGMSLEQAEVILGKYRKQGLDQNGTNSRDPHSPKANPLGGIDKNLIIYPLEDQTTSGSTEQRTYRARTRRGDLEYAVIDFQAGRVVAVHLLR